MWYVVALKCLKMNVKSDVLVLLSASGYCFVT